MPISSTTHLLTNNPHQHIWGILFLGASHVSCILKLHGHISSRSFSLVPSLNLQGQSLSPYLLSLSKTPLIIKSTWVLSGFSLKSLFCVKFSQTFLNSSGSILESHYALCFFLVYFNICIFLQACGAYFRPCCTIMYIVAHSASPKFFFWHFLPPIKKDCQMQ